MAAIVQFDNVGLRYGTGAETLSGLSFSLASGSFHFLTGASGAGKTSLINLMTLAVRPSRGIIRLFGEESAALPRHRLPVLRRRIGVVHQDSRLVPTLNAYDNVALPLRIAGMEEREIGARVDELLHWIGLAPRARAFPATLSGGEQQRVAIARAVIAHPELIVADEPTGNVDPDMAARLLQLLRGLSAQGTSVLVATHDLHLIGKVPGAITMRLARGRLEDGIGGGRAPVREDAA
ncbi:ATP-binding cassette domain-containing protein [uncultured Sphingomonas sp.]|uniref:cell division ATP-binding protein FtsE n=1 Tax=uncultured Sphingomonas sp. TaxID=158754 RepID=UPI0025ED1C66|nr:ATP-binding cassette domain-containing protein [uncultured Sphingomonas sp.]